MPSACVRLQDLHPHFPLPPLPLTHTKTHTHIPDTQQNTQIPLVNWYWKTAAFEV